jgi:hypothetical protein
VAVLPQPLSDVADLMAGFGRASVCAAVLDRDELDWLREAVLTLRPDHVWLDRLS